jgi:alpha-galactosidase
VSDHIRAEGVKSLLWFEPERVNPGTKVFTEHPEFMLSKPEGGDKLLNLGDERAQKWVIEMVDRTMTEQGIDLFRSDFNIDPLPYWRAADTEDRQGITEIRYVEGFLAYWDELHKRRPNLIIDTCASGGRRNDLETLRRAVPLLRSDYILEPVGQQNHTMGIARWIPYYGTGANSTDAYIFRSQMCPWFTACYDVRRTDLDYDTLRRLHGQWKRISPLFMKDFYPLTPYATENTAWVAWQFHDPERGEGVIQAFRRGESFYEAAALRLQGLDEQANYVVTDADAGTERKVSGRELSEGLSIAMKTRPAAALITYRRVE